jgi:hypothetical protein
LGVRDEIADVARAQFYVSLDFLRLVFELLYPLNLLLLQPIVRPLHLVHFGSHFLLEVLEGEQTCVDLHLAVVFGGILSVNLALEVFDLLVELVYASGNGLLVAPPFFIDSVHHFAVLVLKVLRYLLNDLHILSQQPELLLLLGDLFHDYLALRRVVHIHVFEGLLRVVNQLFEFIGEFLWVAESANHVKVLIDDAPDVVVGVVQLLLVVYHFLDGLVYWTQHFGHLFVQPVFKLKQVLLFHST